MHITVSLPHTKESVGLTHGRGLGGRPWIRNRHRRIKDETEPPNSATETGRGCGVLPARNPRSPVRIAEGPTPKTPRNRGDFSGCASVRAGSLRNSRLGGGASGIRTLSTRLSVLSAASARPFGGSVERKPLRDKANRKRIRFARLASKNSNSRYCSLLPKPR